MRLFAATCICVLALTGVQAATAAQRYAAPAGTGTECTKEKPCSVQTAVEAAPGNDEVIVEPGTYTVATQITNPAGKSLFIHGDFGGPMPQLNASSLPEVFTLREKTVLDYLAMTNGGKEKLGTVCEEGTRVERVLINVSGEKAEALLEAANCAVRDSVLRADGVDATALHASGSGGGAVVRNVTAIATGAGSRGISAICFALFSDCTYTLDLKNSIADGAAGDLIAEESFIPVPMAPTGLGDIAVTNSNFDKAVQEGGATVTGSANQTAAPIFANAPGGDYREAAGSPTIDAGVSDQLGSLDLGGNPRTLGSAPDIGAFEFVPSASSGMPGGVRSLRVKPKRFRARPSGGPVVGSILRSKPPVGTAVTYTVSGDVEVDFSVSRAHRGRLVGRRCVKRSRSNAGHKRCAYYTPVKGVFTQNAATGSNHFGFSGRIGGKTLKPGRYKLTALAGHLISAAFTIVR